jgi:hypothetical protein
MSNESKNRLKTFVGRLVLAALVGAATFATVRSPAHPPAATTPAEAVSTSSETQQLEVQP